MNPNLSLRFSPGPCARTPVRKLVRMRAGAPSRAGGFTLIEVMVSTVVALFAALAIIQTFAVAESYRRTGASGGDASFNGAIGTSLIAHDASLAGYGINSSAYLGCLASGMDVSSTTNRNFSFTLAPALITPALSAQQADSITLVASNTSSIPGPLALTVAQSSPTSNYTVATAFGVTAGDVLLLAQAGGTTCTVVQATNTPISGSINQSTILHASGTYALNGSNYRARYNPSGGIGPTWSTSAVLMDLGPAPVVNTYYILNNTTLYLHQPVSGQIDQAVASNVVQMRALYGKDTNADGIVDTWNTTAPASATDWANVLAIRVALAARSVQPALPNAAGVCTATPAAPVVTWEDGSTTTLDVSATANWQCYRYKVFHVTTSLRNLIWTPS
jgi:type IV pilus assembly protein PilW